jgi:hypothetical protein
LWQSSRLLGGYRAGIAAMILWVAHPELPRYFPSEMTEPIFLFRVFGWIYAVALMTVKERATWGVVLLGAAMLTITLLSRPVLQLLAPAGLALCLVCLAYWKLRKLPAPVYWPSVLNGLAWSLALGLILPLALVLKNGIVFGLWGLGAGSGVALYLGTHPLTQGVEPAFLGFQYALLTHLVSGGDPLSLASDRAMRGAAIWQIQSMSPLDALVFFGRKLWWWLAHHPMPIGWFGGALRQLRFFELLTLLAAAIVWLHDWRRRAGRRDLLASGRMTALMTRPQWVFLTFLLAMFLAMLAQMLPILYNSRYSSALLDPWLIPLAAWGLAYLFAPIRLTGAAPWLSAIGVLAAILVLTFGGYDLARKYENVAVDPQRMGQTVVHLDMTDGSRVETQGMAPRGDHFWVVTEPVSALEIRLNPADVERVTAAKIANALWKTDLALSARQGCGRTDIAYRAADGRLLQPAYRTPLRPPLEADGAFHPIVTHANHELRPHEPGRLRIVLNCPVGTEVRWQGTQLLESRHVGDSAAHVKP